MKIKKEHISLAILILIPSLVNLLVPVYNKSMPDLYGLPFFYWFQTIWLFVCTGFYLVFAYLMKKKEENKTTTSSTGVHEFN